MLNKIIFVLLLAVSIASSLWMQHQKSSVEEYASKLSRAYSRVKFVEQDYWQTISYDASRTIAPDILIRDRNNNVFDVQSAVGNGKKLIVRYSELNCNSCVDSLLHYASIFAQNVDSQCVMVWAKYSNVRDFHLLFRLNKAQLNICNVEVQISEYDNINNPYVFVLDEDLTVRRLFFPHKELPEYAKKYFDTVKAEFL